MKINKIKKSKGFTLIELLIVIGILAVLAVTLLLALNPAEAQKRTRDTKRLRDAATLQAIINQYLESGQAMSVCLTTNPNGCNSVTNGPQPPANTPQTCQNTNWLGINVCAYAQSVPVDPGNGQLRTFVIPGSGSAALTAMYMAAVSGSNYEINTRLEAQSNRDSLSADGGSNNAWYEVFSGPSNIL